MRYNIILQVCKKQSKCVLKKIFHLPHQLWQNLTCIYPIKFVFAIDLPFFVDMPWLYLIWNPVVAVCTLYQQYFQLNHLPVKPSGTDILSFFKKKNIIRKSSLSINIYLIIRAQNTSTTVTLSLSNILIYVRFAKVRPLLETHYDTNNFKGIPAWGYEFLLR